MTKRCIVEMIAGTAILLGGFGGGVVYAERNLGIQGELQATRQKLDANYTGSQSEMTFVSECQLALAQMELDHLNFSIWNQRNFNKIEAEFQNDVKNWEDKLQKEMSVPSEFEGGSFAPMDHNIRMTSLVEKRINELKRKWCKK